MIELDPRTRELLAEVRELGRTYMRPMGLESDRTGAPPPADHPFYLICARQGGLVSRVIGENEGKPSEGRPERGSQAAAAARSEPKANEGDLDWKPSEGRPEPDLQGRSVGRVPTRSSEGPRSEPKANEGELDWKPLRALLTAEESAYWDRGVALSLPGPGLGGAALRSMATPEQRERFLAPFADHSRAHWGAMAMTEPGAGSDVARIQTRARRDGSDWRLDGAKMFCSNGARADWVVVWATVDPAKGRDGHRAFVVPRGTPGFELLKIEHKMGSRGYETASFALDGVRVPAENLLGGESAYRTREGFRGAMATFNLTRPIHAAQGVGMGRAAYDHAVAFVRAEYPSHGLRRRRALERLAEIRRGLQTARLLCIHAVLLARRNRPNSLEASYAKLFAPPVVFRAIAAALDIVGEAGVRADAHLEKLYRDVKILDIGEGTQQVQRLVIARQLLGLPREG